MKILLTILLAILVYLAGCFIYLLFNVELNTQQTIFVYFFGCCSLVVITTILNDYIVVNKKK